MIRPHLLRVLALAAVACGTTPASTPRGTPDAGGDPGTSALFVTPTSARVVAGSGPLAMHATLTGPARNVAWTLSGPGALGAVSGADTTYTPPATVGSETTATLTASDGAGLTAAATITVSPATSFTVTGRVVGPTGRPLAGIDVGIGSARTVSDAEGRFTVPDVSVPYDVDLVLAETPLLVGRFEGLRRPDPTLVFVWLFDRGDPKAAVVRGSITGGDPVGTPGTFTAAFVVPDQQQVGLDALAFQVTTGNFSVPFSWSRPETFTGEVHVLQFRSAGPSQPPTEITGHGVHGGLSFFDGAEIGDAGVTLTRPVNATVSGTAVAPDGYAISEKSLALEVSGRVSLPLGLLHTPTPDVSFVVPAGIDATAAVSVSASTPEQRTTSARRSGIAPGTSDLSLTLPLPALPTSPADGARGVAPGSDLTWTPLANGVHVVILHGPVGSPSIFVVTSGTHTRLPDFGHDAAVTWVVAGFAPYADVDAFTAGANFFPVLGDTVQTASEVRTLTLE